MKTYVYIDGFNLYYGAVKGTPYKWLDLLQMCRKLLPKNEIVKIKYYTAKVGVRPNDPDQPVRQQIYLLEPVRIVRYELGKPVGMLCPHEHPSFSLKRLTSFMKPIRQGVLKDSQFPTTMKDSIGTFSKPKNW